jgi:dTDP-4-dehydrorhamnose 3,5-epimerase
MAEGGAVSTTGEAVPGRGEQGRVDGVRWGSLAVHGDDRGAFRELLRASWAGGARAWFTQANLSTSREGVLRGLHYHRRQDDRWTVLRGRVFVALVDVRPLLVDIDATPAVETRTLPADHWVEIPAGVAHGFYAVESCDLLYFVTNEFDGTDELGFAWDDPAVGVPWPAADPILSARDRSNPSLRDLVRSLR